MMISPETYYEEFLQGKSQKAVLEQISLLREEISRLKKMLERGDVDPDSGITPDAMTRIKCDRDYLEMAKRALEEAGGQYKPTEEELLVQSFNMALNDMCRFTLEIGGYFGGYTKYKYTISEEKVLFDVEHSLYLKPSNLPVYEPFTRKEFLQGIAAFHIGEWKQEYDDLNVLDGTQWSICIEYDGNREPVEISGSNAYPYNFEELLKFLNIDYFDSEDENEDEDDLLY